MANRIKPDKNPGQTFLITSALPYANGDIHLGHLVEVVQTDIFVRFQRLCGHKAVYVCADDTHGTPIELSAHKRGISPEELIAEAWENHIKDYSAYSIGFDIFYTTNSPENRYYAELIFHKLREKGLVVEKEVEQYYCQHDRRFLPDRFITGICPKCKASDQYGDVCEACGATYSPTDLEEPRCIICNGAPVLKRSTHFFVRLDKREAFLREYLNTGNVLQEEMKNFVENWINEGLREWCVSRDGPYFGFLIPGTTNKYFYVWLDAPIGYLSSTAKWCKDHGKNVDDYWGGNSKCSLVHFIGKDIVYFHTLFWPVMLSAGEFKLPTKIFVHGFLTVEGEKMSKTRGTFILASDYSKKVLHPYACEYLRFYYGAKLSNNTGDIDLNIDEFCNRINTTLVNNIGNLHHRTFVFIDRYYESRVPDASWDEEIAKAVEKTGREIAEHFNRVEFKSALEKLHLIGNIGNKYYQDSKPWELIKTNPQEAARVMVTCVNIIKALAVFLKPVVPAIASKLEAQYNMVFSWEDHRFSIRNAPLGKTEKIVSPIQKSDFAALLERPTGEPKKEIQSDEEDNLIDINDFSKIDLRVGVILDAERVENSDKLIKLIVDTGEDKRQIVAGIGKHYSPENLKGKRIVFIANLKAAKLMGQKSEGMLLAAQKGDKMVLLTTDDQIKPGAKVS